MSDNILLLIQYWRWFREENKDGTIEQFLDYIVDQFDKGNGL